VIVMSAIWNKSQLLVQVIMAELDLHLIADLSNLLMSIGAGLGPMSILLLRLSTLSEKAEASIYLPKMLPVPNPGRTIGQQDRLTVTR